MELLWRVDERDEPLGSAERHAAHAGLVIHRSGVVFLLDAQRRVYLSWRAATKTIFPGCHDTSASFHVSHGESYEQAAQREACEELGISKALTRIGKFFHDDPPERQFVAVFVMEHDGEIVTHDPLEASGGAFRTLSEAARLVASEPRTPWLRDGLPLLARWLESQVSSQLPWKGGAEP